MKKRISLILILMMLISFGACGQESPKEPEPQLPIEEKIHDANGNEFAKPESVDHISVVTYGGAIQEMAALGQSEKVVSMPEAEPDSMLLKVFPILENAVDVGALENVNVESLLNLEPDVVFGPSQKKQAQLEELGLKTFALYCSRARTETLMDEFRNLGLLFDATETSDKLINYFNEKMTCLEETLSKIPESERKSVYYVKDDITSAMSFDFIHHYFDVAHVDFALGDGNAKEVSVEQVLAMDPDMIMTWNRSGEGYGVILNDERIENLRAVKEKQIIIAPEGVFTWERPSPEILLGYMWMAKTVYPEYTEEIDLKAEAKAFYHDFYNYELSDEEYERFFYSESAK